MKTPERKPDLNTESMNIWVEKKEGLDKPEGIKVKYKEIEIELLGFTPIKDDKDEVIFAWKTKNEEKIILFIKLKECEKTDKLEDLLKNVARVYNYNMQDAREYIKSLYLQKGSIGKL